MIIRLISNIFIFILLAISFVACPPPPTPTPTCYVKKATWGVDYAMLFSYNAAKKLTEQRIMKGSTEIARYTYTYNAQGNVDKMTAILSSTEVIWTSPTSHEYIYNANNQLIEVKRVLNSPSPYTLSNKFTLDNTGRIIEDKQEVIFPTDYHLRERSFLTYQINYTYDVAGNATNTNVISRSGFTYAGLSQSFQFDNKKNLYKNFPLYAPLLGSVRFTGAIRDATPDKTTNINNWSSADIPMLFDIAGNAANWAKTNITFTYNAQGYPLTETYGDGSITTNITYEYDCM